MIFLGVKVSKNEKGGKTYVRKRGYFARSIKPDQDGSRGMIPVTYADFNSDIDVSKLEVGKDYCVETYEVERMNKETGEVYKFKYVSSIK